jgi:predicted amidohydrolase
MNDRKLTGAAIQMDSRNGNIAGNLARAGRGADEAARQGTELLLPELFSTGFEINAHTWPSAEPQRGPTECLPLAADAETWRARVCAASRPSRACAGRGERRLLIFRRTS